LNSAAERFVGECAAWLPMMRGVVHRLRFDFFAGGLAAKPSDARASKSAAVL
jgi:hypothetical protein